MTAVWVALSQLTPLPRKLPGVQDALGSYGVSSQGGRTGHLGVLNGAKLFAQCLVSFVPWPTDNPICLVFGAIRLLLAHCFMALSLSVPVRSWLGHLLGLGHPVLGPLLQGGPVPSPGGLGLSPLGSG